MGSGMELGLRLGLGGVWYWVVGLRFWVREQQLTKKERDLMVT